MISLISSLGDDDASAGTAVKRLIVAFLGAPVGATWVMMGDVAWNIAEFEREALDFEEMGESDDE